MMIAALLLLPLLLNAQNSQRQKVIHMAAVRIAGQIGVAESDTELFIRTYQAYKKETSAILSEVAAESGTAEQDIENKILGDFGKSLRLLELRESYYHSFRAFLRPSQIQMMYDIEKAAVREK